MWSTTSRAAGKRRRARDRSRTSLRRVTGRRAATTGTPAPPTAATRRPVASIRRSAVARPPPPIGSGDHARLNPRHRRSGTPLPTLTGPGPTPTIRGSMSVVPLALRRDPLDVLASLAREPGAFLLEIPDETRPFVLLGCSPVAELWLAERPIGDALLRIERFVAETPLADPTLPFPLRGGVVGCLGYELGRLIEPAADGFAPRGELPLAMLRRYDPIVAYDRSRGQYALLCADA